MEIFTFTWFIQNYSYCLQKENKYLSSPTFFAQILQGTSWNLHLYPRGTKSSNSMTFFLNRSDVCSGPEKIALNCELSILDANGETLKSTKLKINSKEKLESFEFPTFYEQSEYNPVNIDFTLDILRMRCKMRIGEGDIIIEDICYAKTIIGYENISFIKSIENFSTLEPNLTKSFYFESVSINDDALTVMGDIYIESKTDWEYKVILEISEYLDFNHLKTCKIYILKSTGEEVECGKIDTRNKKSSESGLNTPLCFGNECLSNNKLTLRFECTLSTGIEYEAIEETLYDSHLTPLHRKEIHDKYFGPPEMKPKSA